MAIFYLDAENGSDANTGNTFAQRWKTLNSGATAARTAPGDIIRIMASPDRTSMGQSATFTNKSDTLTLTTAVTANVSLCELAWTASANVVTTTSAVHKQGTVSTSIAPAAAFTTGLAAYETISSTDFSGYQQISFWIQTSVATAANSLTVKLCSDTLGVTAVDTFQIPHNLVAARWYPITINKGSALGSAIQSVALYVDIDFGAATVLLDNIMVCKAVASADSLTLNSTISKNASGELEYPIRSINGVTVMLDIDANSAFATTPRGYSGTTESVTAYKRNHITHVPIDTTTPWGTVQEAGTSGNLTTYSGGWNRTDMSTQTGETWVDSLTSQVNLITCTLAFIGFNKMFGVRSSIAISNSGADGTISDCGGVGTGSTPIAMSGLRVTQTGLLSGCSCNGTLSVTSTSGSLANLKALSTSAAGGVLLGVAGSQFVQTGTVTGNNCGTNGVTLTGGGSYGSVVASDNANPGFLTGASLGLITVQSVEAMNNGATSGASFNAATSATINSLTTSGNVGNSISWAGSGGQRLIIKNPVYAEATFHGSTIVAGSQAFLQVQNDNGTGNHFIKTDGGIIRSDAGANRHTAVGLAWGLFPTSTFHDANYPLRFRIGYVKLVSGVPKLVSAWVKRSSTNLNSRIICPGGQISGIAFDVSSIVTFGAGSYEQLFLTLTSSTDGVVEIFCDAWGGTSNSAYVDDVQV